MNELLNFGIADLNFQLGNKLGCTIVNPDHSGDNPAPVYTSQNTDNPEHLNKLEIEIKNQGAGDLVLNVWPMADDLPRNADGNVPLDKLSYVRIDFADFVDEKFIAQCQLAVQKIEDVTLEFVQILKLQEQLGLYVRPSNSGLEKTVWILRCVRNFDKIEQLQKEIATSEDKIHALSHPSFIPPKKEINDNVNTIINKNNELEKERNPQNFVLKKNETLNISVSNLISFVRPSLRYLDVSWKNDASKDDHVLVQNTLVLKRPSYFVEPPFPLEIFWLDNHNVAYISKSEGNQTQEIENEFSFGISNKGLKPLTLDCRQEVHEGPYFELVFLGGSGVGDATEDKYIKDIQLRIKEDDYGNKWTHHKMIQGPVVTWRIEPRMYTDGKRNKIILGIEDEGTITFSLSQLKVIGAEGVSMLYLRYYNIPDFDDNQIVLYIEKKKPTGSIPSAGFASKYLSIDDGDSNNGQKHAYELNQKFLTPPLRWQMIMGKNRNTTHVVLGDKVGIGRMPAESFEVEGSALVTKSLQLGNCRKIMKSGEVTMEIKSTGQLAKISNLPKESIWTGRLKIIVMEGSPNNARKSHDFIVIGEHGTGTCLFNPTITGISFPPNGNSDSMEYEVKYNVSEFDAYYWIELETFSSNQHPTLL